MSIAVCPTCEAAKALFRGLRPGYEVREVICPICRSTMQVVMKIEPAAKDSAATSDELRSSDDCRRDRD